jgi:phosphoribosylformylglycinamidine synthase
MFSLMWSEHCSYKHSRKLLSRFPTEGERVLQGPGENAGIIDVGGGWGLALKVESHNHPSAVEPFEGAATGVGGIVRDILAMGARPIALLDSLRFGELESARSRHLFTRAVEGIGHYGNCIGVPTVGGEVAFDDRYEDSCLVNAMCVGVVRSDRILRAAASGPGNALVLIGNRTGRDGIGGASVLASAELSEDEDRRPSVQVSDPFTERKLMDCCLELADEGLFVALQDLGAAGLTSSASEMAAKGGVGLEIDLDAVPLRETGMVAAEILVSESQERMLGVVKPNDVAQVVAVCERWDLDATRIGTVTELPNLVARMNGEVVVDLPAELLADRAPLYDVPVDAEPAPAPLRADELPAEPSDPRATWREMMGRANLGSRRWIYEQYDHLVGANTVLRPGGDAAVVRLPDGIGAVAITTDCAEVHCELAPREGGMATVFEAARNLAVAGARPLAATDCLNFPNPEKGPTGWRLTEVIEGMSVALEALGVPVVSGNVSLYNESATRRIYPTPVVGMVGAVAPERALGHAFRAAGETVVLIGYGARALDGSAYLGAAGCPPPPDPALEVALGNLLVMANDEGLLHSAHDLAAGGLAVALAECCIAEGVGATVALAGAGRLDEQLFGEGCGWVLVSCDADDVRRLAPLAPDGLVVHAIGETGGDRITIGLEAASVTASVAELATAYEAAIPGALNEP